MGAVANVYIEKAGVWIFLRLNDECRILYAEDLPVVGDVEATSGSTNSKGGKITKCS